MFAHNFPVQESIWMILFWTSFNQVVIQSLIFSIHLNIRDINFREYLFDSMGGFGIIQYYDHSSIFVKRRKSWKPKPVEQTEISDS